MNWAHQRGFVNVLPYDPLRQEFLYLGASASSASIYSNGIWAYVPTRQGVRGHMVLRVHNGLSAGNPNDCAISSSSDISALRASPLSGHPMGHAAFDTTRNKLYMSGWLCAGFFQSKTHSYDSVSSSMDPDILAYEYQPACVWKDIFPHMCGGRLNQSWVYVSQAPSGATVDRVVLGISDGNGSRRVVEYNPATQSYCVVGDTCPGPGLTGSDGLACGETNCPPRVMQSYGITYSTLDRYVWIWGGCNGTSPGNGLPNLCNGVNQNDLWKYDAELRRFSRVSPAGGIKPPATNASNPWFAFDSRRNRFLVYADTNALWQYDVAGNAWSALAAANAGPVITPQMASGSNGAIAGYDPASDIMVLIMTGTGGQSNVPTIWELGFGGR